MAEPQSASHALTDEAHDRRLLHATRPADWQNPQPTDRYHLVVVGGGTGGQVAAAVASNLGARVALVEARALGGDRIHSGSVPSHGLLRAARGWHDTKRAASDFGGPTACAEGDFDRVMERLRRLRADIAGTDGAERFREMGVDVFFGQGRFVAGDELEVDGVRLRFRKAIVATGARPALPEIDGLAETPHLTSETIFSLAERPASLGVVGGGPVGCELSQAFARFGSNVALWEQQEGLLTKDDAEAASVVESALRRDEVGVELGAQVTAVRPVEEGVEVTFDRDGREQLCQVKRLLLAAGRRPNVEGLGLEAAGVDYGPEGITVDARLRSTNKNVYAVGDVVSSRHFTHLAMMQARLAVRNALFLGRRKATGLVIPRCTYTDPELAHVGHTRASAEASGHEVQTLTLRMEQVDRARLDGDSEGFLRLHMERGTDRILGGTLVCEGAGELIGQLGFAMTHGLGLARFVDTVFPYPTRSDIFRRAGEQWRRQKLTPTVSKLFDLWFRLLR